jgi:hypothetical protein
MNDHYIHGCLDTLSHLISEFGSLDPGTRLDAIDLVNFLQREYDLVARAEKNAKQNDHE